MSKFHSHHNRIKYQIKLYMEGKPATIYKATYNRNQQKERMEYPVCGLPEI